MWLRNATNFQISCSLKTFFQLGMAVQRIPCCKMEILILRHVSHVMRTVAGGLKESVSGDLGCVGSP